MYCGFTGEIYCVFCGLKVSYLLGKKIFGYRITPPSKNRFPCFEPNLTCIGRVLFKCRLCEIHSKSRSLNIMHSFKIVKKIFVPLW